MEFKEFSNILKELANKIEIDIDEEQISKFYEYMNLLIEWNNKMNLTTIVDPRDIILKHFIDSTTIERYIQKEAKVIDIGTGAGFPGIPVKIIREDIKIILMDSLNKRINFLNEVINQSKLTNIEAIHARAEELARDNDYREKFDIATSRAVASLNVLLEYMLPFVKVGGHCICMKGPNIEEEVESAKNALKELNAEIEKIESFCLPESDYSRNIIIIKKTGINKKKYPRKAGTPSKEPL